MEEKKLEITMEQIEDYQFKVDFGVGQNLLMDEPSPLGADQGPNAGKVLTAAIANCLSASLLFCLQKARIDSKVSKTRATTTLTRNDKGRFRVGGTKIEINVELDQQEEAQKRIAKCLELFEDFCIVTESVRSGIEVEVEVLDQNGKKLKG